MISNQELELIAYNRVCDLIKKNLGVTEPITKETTGDDLRMDSLDNIELVLCLEDTFDIDISDEVWEKCDNVGDIHKLVLKSRPTIHVEPVLNRVEKVKKDFRWSWGGWW